MRYEILDNTAGLGVKLDVWEGRERSQVRRLGGKGKESS